MLKIKFKKDGELREGMIDEKDDTSNRLIFEKVMSDQVEIYEFEKVNEDASTTIIELFIYITKQKLK